MSVECSECERDLRGGHADDCSRAQPREPQPQAVKPRGVVVTKEMIDEATAGMDALVKRLAEATDVGEPHVRRFIAAQVLLACCSSMQHAVSELYEARGKPVLMRLECPSS